MSPVIRPGSSVADPEYAEPGEPQFDFCLWEYPPVESVAGKLRSINLLQRSFELQGLVEPGMALVHAIREGLGLSRSVWGIKQQENGQISWEFYFYDYARLQRSRSIPRLLNLIRPWIGCEVPTSEAAPYFMFSIDIDRDTLLHGKPLEAIQVYIGNIGSQVSSGICYEVTRSQTQLKNFYFFFDAASERENILGKASASIFLDGSGFDINAILWPEMLDCQVIVIANKQDRDGVYFSRVNVGQLLLFLRRMNHPEEQVAYIEQNKAHLSHMLYDVGFDYRMEGDKLKIVKSGWYGVF